MHKMAESQNQYNRKMEKYKLETVFLNHNITVENIK